MVDPKDHCSGDDVAYEVNIAYVKEFNYYRLTAFHITRNWNDKICREMDGAALTFPTFEEAIAHLRKL